MREISSTIIVANSNGFAAGDAVSIGGEIRPRGFFAALWWWMRTPIGGPALFVTPRAMPEVRTVCSIRGDEMVIDQMIAAQWRCALCGALHGSAKAMVLCAHEGAA